MNKNADTFMMGYLHKSAAPEQQPQSMFPYRSPAAYAANQVQNQQGGVGGALNAWVNPQDPTNRSLGEGAAAGGLGAAAGYMMGGDAGSAMMGGALGSLLYYLANTFFGKDMQKARQYVNMKYQQGTLPQTLKKLEKQTGQQFDEKETTGRLELENLQRNVKNITDPEELAEAHKQIAKLTAATGQETPFAQQANQDLNNNGIPDTQEGPGQDLPTAQPANEALQRIQAIKNPQQPMPAPTNQPMANQPGYTNPQQSVMFPPKQPPAQPAAPQETMPGKPLAGK